MMQKEQVLWNRDFKGGQEEHAKVVLIDEYRDQHKESLPDLNYEEEFTDGGAQDPFAGTDREYILGILSGCGYGITLLLYVLCQMDVTKRGQLITLLVWAGLDIAGYIGTTVRERVHTSQVFSESFPEDSGYEGNHLISEYKGSKSENKLQSHIRIGA